nr:MAG TPA: TRAF PROTEIN, TRAO PROTEIN, TRAN ADHESION, BACTERIAL SECRETION.5A [Caudoviricetes sp.]
MKPFIAFSFILALTACAHTQPRLNGSGTQYQAWQTQVLEECARKAATITVELMEEKAKEGVLLSVEQGYAINRYVLELCYKRNGIVI